MRPAAPGALEGSVRAVVGGARLRIPWAAAVPVTRLPVVNRVALSAAVFPASDRKPAVLSLVAGRVDGSAERPQLLPLARLEIELYRGKRRVGTLVRLRDVLPGPVRLRPHRARAAGARLPRPLCAARARGARRRGARDDVTPLPLR